MTWLRHRLAPPGSRREALGRKIVQGAVLRTRRQCRIAWQRVLQANRLSLAPSLPAIDAPQPCDGPYDIVCLPIIRWPFRFQRPQQLMRQFARHGHRVFYLSDEFLLARPVAVAPIEPNVYGLSVSANAAIRPYEGRLSAADVWSMADGVARLRALDPMRPTRVLVQHPWWAPLAEELRTRFGWPIVYDCMDDHAGLGVGRRAASKRLDAEDRLLRTADLTVVTSEWLLDRGRALARRTALVRNGVDYEHFASVSRPAPPGEVVVGYYGAIAHWFDARLVADLAKLRPDWRFELVGNTFSADLTPLAGLPNVRLLGEMPYAAVPEQLARWQCCVIPFVRNDLTEATNPVKVYEMLAAGMPVVAVNLPELRPIAAAGLIELADDAQGFAKKIDRLLENQSPELVAARRAFARKNTWHDRYCELAAAMTPLDRADKLPEAA
ncbi:MAG: glycosyltransferase [Thermoguttaceae bacterium]